MRTKKKRKRKKSRESTNEHAKEMHNRDEGRELKRENCAKSQVFKQFSLLCSSFCAFYEKLITRIRNKWNAWERKCYFCFDHSSYINLIFWVICHCIAINIKRLNVAKMWHLFSLSFHAYRRTPNASNICSIQFYCSRKSFYKRNCAMIFCSVESRMTLKLDREREMCDFAHICTQFWF